MGCSGQITEDTVSPHPCCLPQKLNLRKLIICTQITVKCFNLAADCACKIILAAFILANSNRTISTQHTAPIKVRVVSIFTPFISQN